MGLQPKKKLRGIVGTLKDKASLLSSAASLSPDASAAVLRATPHHPSSQPAPRRHLDALLFFGHGARPAAAAAVAALLSRLRGTRDAAVALKCLALAHHAARRGGFILRDQLLSALLPRPSGGSRNPLNLSAFRDGSTPDSWALSVWVRWYARVLEQLLSCHRAAGVVLDRCNGDTREGKEEERAASLPNADLLREMDALVGLLEEAYRAPDAAGSELVEEVLRWVREDSAVAEKEVIARVKEMGERMACLGFGDAVELACLLKRLEGCGGGGAAEEDFGLLLDAVAEVKEKVAAAATVRVVEDEQRQRGGLGRVGREKTSESARLDDQVRLLSSAGNVRFGSTRWSDR